ncbi:transposase [Actinokineospora auranticolor]|uniref:IS701 family transposase n=1 Tax=Actinokineospora auranticolor TaxID=155976 RepID=UPI000CECA289|nr:transposase [Actinokineospora auranticolor]
MDDALFAELCGELFGCLPRVDQRVKAAVYVRGLLCAEGRKSVRKLAAVSGGAVSEQGLHHFVSESTWDWRPVRAVLARYVAGVVPVRAWVVRPMVIPKAGEHSVGVDRGVGQLRNAQYAVGVWAASEAGCGPVSWRLHLPRVWLDDRDRRSRAAIPEEAGAETVEGCAVSASLEVAGAWGLPSRPVVFDARSASVAAVVRRFRAAGVPVLLRVGSATRLVRVGGGAGEVAARHLVAGVRHLRRPVRVPGARSAEHTAAAVVVRLPGGTCEFVLVGHWVGRGAQPEYWLSDLVTAGPAALVSLSRLVGLVDGDFGRLTDGLGVRDYVGRSYDGWHRHVTLVSVAHAVAALSEAVLSYAG